MDRNLISRTTALIVLLTSLATLAEAQAASAGTPNVIVIFADDLGYGDLGCFGHPQFKTPNLDRMATEGARCTDFYVPMPYCAPSRAAILTGRYPFRPRVVLNPTPDGGIDDLGLPPEEVTIAEALKPAGYATQCIGKWHLGHVPEFYPRTQGFDSYYGILYSNDMRPVNLIENETVVEYPVIQATLTKRYTQRALQFIEANRSQPFFLYLPHAMPHKPLAASEEFYKTSGAGLYGDVIAELDWSVGQILSKLKELKLDENTLVVFTSDNGPWYGGSTGGLRGMKGKSWEGGVRVPMIARWPGRIPPGRVIKAAAGTIDLFPTIVRLAGQPLPAGRVIDGRDIMPLLSGKTDTSPHEGLFAMRGTSLAFVRSGKWKLHLYAPGKWPQFKDDWVDPRGPDGVTIIAPCEQARPSEYPGVRGGDESAPPMLFDVEADPAEQHNVAAQHPDVVQRLAKMFETLNAEVPPANELLPKSRQKQQKQRKKGAQKK